MVEVVEHNATIAELVGNFMLLDAECQSILLRMVAMCAQTAAPASH